VAVDAALGKASAGRKTDCQIVGVRPLDHVRKDWPAGSMQDPMIEYLDGADREDWSPAGLDEGDPREIHVCMFTDGSYERKENRAGFGVAFRRVAEGEQGVNVHTDGVPVGPTIWVTLPKRYGSATRKNHQAELIAPIVGIPRMPVGGDGMDNQAVVQIMLREGTLTARERSKANDNTLEARLLRIGQRVSAHATHEGGEGP
jgi:ribonuclease HI